MGKETQTHQFLIDWKKHNRKIFEQMYPQLSEEQINKFLDKVITERLKNPIATMHNNYVGKDFGVDLLKVIDWIHDTKPIVAGFGVFYRNQDEVVNPMRVMIENFIAKRKEYKGLLEVYGEGTYEYDTADRMQGGEKINVNSLYGANGAPTSNFFNIYTATSVTATGQSLISTTQQAFEGFLENNVPFIDLDECMLFLENIKKETYILDDSFLPNVPIEALLKRLEDMFYEYNDSYTKILYTYLMNLPQNIINRIYFKNNLYEFSFLRKIRVKLYTILRKADEFKNPNKLPENIKSNLEDLWDFYKQFVFYNYAPFNRIQRLKHNKRKAVIVVDTDSNMLNLNPWVVFMNKYIISADESLKARNQDELRFICINTMSYIITNMVTDVLAKYTKDANVPKRFRKNINMKNEYLFTRIILSNVKKRYISSIRLREGKEVFPEKLDIKGMDFSKSSIREETKDFFMTLIKQRLLYTDNINLSDILKDLEDFENMIRGSLMKGEKHFLIPKSVKELGAYDDPYREQGIRGVIVWNYLYPENTVELPEKIDIVKVSLTKEENLDKLRDLNPKYYDVIQQKIINNSNPKISKKGVEIIAIPRNVPSIPDWMKPFIDYDTVVNNNVSTFNSVLKALGIETIRTSKKSYFSNILKL